MEDPIHRPTSHPFLQSQSQSHSSSSYAPATTTTDLPAPPLSTQKPQTHEKNDNDTPLDIFPSLPPFPTSIPTAPLVSISLRKLSANDAQESAAFFTACKQLGFFYLDLRSSPIGEQILSDADELFEIGKRLYELPVEEKEQYDLGKGGAAGGSYFGYKGYGMAVVDRKGTADRNEFYNVSKDDILALSPPLPAPKLLTSARPLLKSYIETSHSIVTLLLDHLSTHLNLPPTSPNHLPSLHRLHAPSGDQVRFVHAPPQLNPDDQRIALGEHTDFGSVTVLFNRVGGLQVRLPDELVHDESVKQAGGWIHVKPLRHHAIINLGDALTKFTRGLLRSNIHRVAPPPGAQAACTRYSVVYFSRPEDEVLLKGIDEGGVIPSGRQGEELEPVFTARDWTLKRALGRRKGGNLEEGYAFGNGDGRGGKGGED